MVLQSSKKETRMTESSPPPQPPPEPSNIPPSAGGAGNYTGAPPTSDAKTLALISHLLNFTLIVPLLVYLLKKDSHPFVEDQSREALNFALVCTIIHAICWVLWFLCITAIISMIVWILQVIFGIIGCL